MPEVNALWQQKPAWWYDNRFAGGIEERLTWKLKQDVTTPSYYRAITDHEHFLFAMAAFKSLSSNNPDAASSFPGRTGHIGDGVCGV